MALPLNPYTPGLVQNHCTNQSTWFIQPEVSCGLKIVDLIFPTKNVVSHNKQIIIYTNIYIDGQKQGSLNSNQTLHYQWMMLILKASV